MKVGKVESMSSAMTGLCVEAGASSNDTRICESSSRMTMICSSCAACAARAAAGSHTSPRTPSSWPYPVPFFQYIWFFRARDLRPPGPASAPAAPSEPSSISPGPPSGSLASFSSAPSSKPALPPSVRRRFEFINAAASSMSSMSTSSTPSAPPLRLCVSCASTSAWTDGTSEPVSAERCASLMSSSPSGSSRSPSGCASGSFISLSRSTRAWCAKKLRKRSMRSETCECAGSQLARWSRGWDMSAPATRPCSRGRTTSTSGGQNGCTSSLKCMRRCTPSYPQQCWRMVRS
mmetsp:Transcript_3489/g.12515  ORF Transcript_3489/g.12515 Transcript_3489/m.12515 type:complete len:291 (-) Transcript_3489:3614-4486(-)